MLPHFTLLPDNVTMATSGRSVQLNCRADGEPLPTIQWDKDSVLNGFLSQRSADRFTVQPKGTLIISNVQRDDQGRYGCTAGNAGGFKRAEIHLIVQGTTNRCILMAVRADAIELFDVSTSLKSTTL